jgi:hypothetical protein
MSRSRHEETLAADPVTLVEAPVPAGPGISCIRNLMGRRVASPL